MKRATLLFAGLAAMTAAAAHADEIYTYTLYNYPATQAGCEAEAAALGARIAANTGVTIFRTACDAADAESFTLQVNYSAAMRLREVNIYDPDAYTHAAYTSSGACAADLARQVALFTEATGLTPHAAYCGARDGTWLSIRAFGVPEQAPFFFSKHLYGHPVGDVDAFARQVGDAAAAAGLDVFKSIMTGDSFEGYLSLGYYARGQAPISGYENNVFGSVALCEAHKAYVASLHAAGGETILGSICSRLELSYAARLHTISYRRDGNAFFDRTEPSFNSYDACMAQKDRIVAAYRETAQGEVLGAVCSADYMAQSYSVTVYTR